ncbi:hypothetical protein HP398_08810 [Brevibacillus sp. HB1.4B]|uniref:hypothetical protein n=1 Tax=Brevibacillus TaxID=55080 RepID=UPI00156AD687|nr:MULTISPECIES: hypothetical protein [unclassified Brevibacillus]NRS16532.1 hypothetical protein [Brevibacillus sp. HB1.4B]NTU34248.1 hypothetical protein [Brevibacillus sp. HB1.1]
MIWINPPYEVEEVSIITVTEWVEKQARYIRQAGPDHYAIVDFVIEPCQGLIGFKNEALIQDDLKGNTEWERLFPILICCIYDALKEYIQYQYHERNLAIGNFMFKLISLEIRPGSTRLTDFKIATLIGLKEVFENNEAKRSTT